MAGRGETMKMFVVQRTFRTVRKGYDPDEVDRHLELVSRWFTQTDAAKALREERARIEERERAAAGISARSPAARSRVPSAAAAASARVRPASARAASSSSAAVMRSARAARSSASARRCAPSIVASASIRTL